MWLRFFVFPLKRYEFISSEGGRLFPDRRINEKRFPFPPRPASSTRNKVLTAQKKTTHG